MKYRTLRKIAIARKVTTKSVPVIAKGFYYGLKGVYKGSKWALGKVYSGVSSVGRYAGSKTMAGVAYLGERAEKSRQSKELISAGHEAEIRGDYFEAGKLYANAGQINLATRAFDIAGYSSYNNEDYSDAANSFQAASSLYSPKSSKSRRYAGLAAEMFQKANQRDSGKSGLVEMTKTVAVLFLFGGSLFLSTLGITGNAFLENVSYNSSFLGIGLFIAGLILTYIFWFKK